MPITFSSSQSVIKVNNVNSNKLKSKPENYTDIFSQTDIYQQKAAGDIITSSIDKEDNTKKECKINNNANKLNNKEYNKVYKSLFNNSLIGGVLEAYNNHHNLILRPDDIWLAIMSQFAVYVDKNNEVLRSKFVSHTGKIKVKAEDVGTRYTVDYPMLVITLVNKCGKYFKNEKIKEWILPNFTTTTNVDRTVGTMVMMSAFQAYFSYKIYCMCGIPNITLLGEPSDWMEIRNRITELSTYDIDDDKSSTYNNKLMTKWKNMLIPILDQFISASNGNVDITFWDKIVSHIPGGSGPSYLSGWITVFGCFSDEGEWCGDNKKIKRCMFEGETISQWPILDTNNISIGFTSVPFDLNDNGEEFKAMFFSGHIFHDVVGGNTIQPRVDWIMTLVDENKKVKERL